MKAKIFRRSISLLMALALCISAFAIPGVIRADAADSTSNVVIISYPRDYYVDPKDPNRSDWNHPELKLMNNWHMTAGAYASIHAMESYDGNICYCIEPGVSQRTDDSLYDKGEGYWDNYPADRNSTITPEQMKDLIGRIFQYGYTGSVSLYWHDTAEGTDTLAYAMATQLLIWETVVGERAADFSKVSPPAGCNSVAEYIGPKHPLRAQIFAHYDSIVASVKQYTTLPSFCSWDKNTVPVKLMWDGARYSATLTDTNNVLDKFLFSADRDDIEFEVQGNQLIITSQEAFDGVVYITVPQKSGERVGIITWTDNNYGGGKQDMVTYTATVNDPLEGYFSVETSLRAQVKLVKVDADSGNVIAYTGAGFRIYDHQGNLITQNGADVFYTDKNGCLITPEALEAGGGYYMVEVQAPDGYVLDATPVYFNVNEESSVQDGGIVVVKLTKENKAQLGTITIGKTGEGFASVKEADGVYQPVYEVVTLSGAVFEITAAENIVTHDGTVHYQAGELVATVTTDENGSAVTAELPLGKYNIREITAPYGMVLDGETKTVELTYAGQEIAVTHTEAGFYNARQKVSVSLNKVMESNELFGIDGDVTAVSFGLYAAEDITAADGTKIPAGGLIEVVTVDENGTAAVVTDLPMGSYYLQEIATDEGYILSDAQYPFTFTYGGHDTEVVQIQINNGEAIVNEIVCGEVRGMKISDTLQPLSGAVIGLFRADETEFTAETALMTTVSAENGAFAFTGVAYGEWVVAEIQSPEGYLMTDARYTVTIDADGDVVELLISNTAIRGAVRLQKVDEADPTVTLSGAVFEIYRDGNGNALFDEGDALVGQLTEGENGLYEMNGLTYGAYFLKEKTAPVGFNADEDLWYFEIREDGEIVTIANLDDGLFGNAAQSGAIRIVKTSDDNVVAGITFLVEGTDVTGGTFSQEYVTDENGEIHIEGLRVGTYVISEVANDVTVKYELPADVTVEVRDGETAEAKFHNKLIEEDTEKETEETTEEKDKQDGIQTGDNANTAQWIAAVLFSMAGITAICTMYFHDHKRRSVN